MTAQASARVAEKAELVESTAARLVDLETRQKATAAKIAGIKAARKAAMVEAVAQGLDAPDTAGLDRDLQTAQRVLEALPTAIAQGEAALAKAHAGLAVAERAKLAELWRWSVSEQESARAEVEKAVAKLVDPLARLVAVELVRDHFHGNRPIPAVACGDSKPWSGEIVALQTLKGIPDRLRSPTLTEEPVRLRAVEMADAMIAELTKG